MVLDDIGDGLLGVVDVLEEKRLSGDSLLGGDVWFE